MSFPSVSPKQSFPALESEVLAYWKANNTFQKSIDSRPEDNPYRFYDGPPFITGMPHYGHMLGSTVKDVVGRYWTMRGRRVERVWGWDCHGLPIEERVQKKLGLKSNADIEERGVKEFIDECYKYTSEVSSEWDWYVEKIGRWVDMKNAYRTMDQDYIESVMWVFSQLWDKGLIYEGKRVSLYSWKLSTPISNFEVAMDDTYQEVNDPAITVKFELEPNNLFPAGAKVLAWTTTPWTIPANMALAVRNDIDYILVENGDEQFIVAKSRAESVFKGKGEYAIIREFKGSELVGLGYVPPFPEYYYQKNGEKNHRIYHADFITDTDGTGIGHEAPEFGDVDFQLAKKEGIYISEAMDEAGRYTSQIFDYEGTHYLDLENPEKGANRINIERMKANNTLFKLESITHRVPFCPRSGTPLMQKAQSSWFIDIQSQKEKLLAANEQINWFPEHLKFGRFAKGIESAPDWCISRTRFWGAPMPVWIGEDGEKVVVSSREEIFEKNKPYGQLTKLIVTRHAESQANVDKHYDDVGLSPLSTKGQEQAESLMQELKDKGVDIIITSPFLRAIQTAEPLAKALGLEIITDERLRETNHGNMTNAPASDAVREERNITFFGDDKDHKFAQTGESYNDVLARTTAVIEDICAKYPGKTVFVVSHGFPTGVMSASLRGKKIANKVENASLETFILDVANKKQLNLHKPYIDSIFLAPENTKKPKKILGVHGMMSDISKESWIERKKEIESQGLSLDLVQFDRTEDPTYESWKNTFDTIDFSQYDCIYTVSLGGAMTVKYLSEKGIKVPKIVMSVPGISHAAENGSLPNVFKVGQELFGYVGSDIADEIIVIHSKDDNIVPYENGKRVADHLGARLITLDEGGHELNNKYTLIAKYLKNDAPKKVLGVQGYLKNESIIDFFEKTAENLQKEGVNIYCPKFELGETVHYDVWEKTFLENIEGVDTVFAHSLGCRFSIDTIIKHQISLKRLVLIAPPEGKHPSLQEFYSNLHEDMSQIRNFVDEVIILYSTDDKPERLESSKDLIEKTGGNAVKVDRYGHFNITESKLIEGLVQHGSPLTRIPEVLDVWMDSGSMPYAQMHYPFENKGEMEASFPADFIAEYVGQVRAWFYVMHVLGVLLNPNNEPKPTPSFTNVITTGVINGNDGRKMSKSYGNYPDPRLTIEKYGADPIRFYMLNSPLLSGGDMDFKEEQIIETVKGVMLPIWNTYSFFTTYANIDQWQHDETEVWYMRHAETTSNASNTMSDGTDDPELTEKGREEAKNAGKTFLEQGKNFDVIIHTGLRRTDDTARIVGAEIGFSGEYVVDSRFLEQAAGEYAGKKLQEIADMHGADVADHPKLRSYYKNNSTENIEQFEERILTAYQDILEQYRGKRILIVAHAGTPRPMIRHHFGRTLEDAHYNIRTLNAEPFRLMTTPLVNELDRWILSRLQVLMGQVHDAMDGYDVSRACRAIVDYMDELTNWYVRLSRRRFWGSEMTADKRSAYETLYTVLTETSKLLAPYMPFMSEDIFRGLTQRESVHLEYITRPSRHLVDSELNRDMEICEHIVSLGLALRSRKNIRVRQPLQSVTITKELSEYYQAIIRDELNVKEVLYENPEKLAKKICKPDARKIGPKYGKDVQKVIMESKNGNFVEKENGIIDVGGFILESGEYVIEYLPLEGVGDVEGGYGIVISLDTTITESLKLEGYARDIIRAIQEMRKEADYQVTDRIALHIYGERHEEILTSYGEMIQSETLSTLAPLMVAPDLEKIVEVDEGISLTLQIER